jgi:hypothetical protein
MKLNMKSIFKNAAVVMATVAVIVSCDSGVNSLGTDFLGIDVDNVIQSEVFDVLTYNTELNPVQTNRFTSQPFGVYDDPVYGTYTYNFVTQATIPLANPDFGTDVAIDSVVISIPLYASVASIEGSNRLYELDSIYNGEATTVFKLYENNYFLNNLNPQDLTQASRFFSDLEPAIDANKGALIFDGLQFKPEKAEVRLIDTDVNGDKIPSEGTDFTVNSREAPAFRAVIARAGDQNFPTLVSNIDYWKNKIIDQQGTSSLSTIREFQNYFRGFYFQVDRTTNDANFAHLNLNNAAVIIYYKSLIAGGTGNLVPTAYRIGLRGNSATLIRKEFNPSILASMQAAGNTTTGDPSLYLKGGPGAMAFVDLFGPDVDMDGEADALTALKARGVVINDATLTFFVDQSLVTAGGQSEPERIIIYDTENNVALADFVLAGGANSIPSVNSNLTHLGRLVREDAGNINSKGVSYTLRLTAHITRILQGVRENVRLGIAVTQNVDLLGPLSFVKDNNNSNAVSINQILAGSAASHEGTVLHGSNSLDTSKRPVFKIFYTESN